MNNPLTSRLKFFALGCTDFLPPYTITTLYFVILEDKKVANSCHVGASWHFRDRSILSLWLAQSNGTYITHADGTRGLKNISF